MSAFGGLLAEYVGLQYLQGDNRKSLGTFFRLVNSTSKDKASPAAHSGMGLLSSAN